MEEVYTVKELAAIMGVPWQTVAAWKRYKQIPPQTMTPEGTFIKSMITPMIDTYKNVHSTTLASPGKASEESPSPKKQNARSMPKKKKGYSKKVRQEAIRLFEQDYSLVQVAEQIGCSTECARRWRLEYRNAQKSKPNPPVSAPKQPRKPTVLSMEEFIRGYWQEGTRAVDVLLLPPEIGPQVTNYVNEALKYAYAKLQ